MVWFDPDWYAHEHELNEEEILDDIVRDVQGHWRSNPWSRFVRDVGSQWKYIQAMRAKYVFPDYLVLVGEPSEDDFIEGGQLSTLRQATLLLIGAFSWQGYIIAKHTSVYDIDHRYGESRWRTSTYGWYVTEDPVPESLSFRNFFLPFAQLSHRRLADVILEGCGRPRPTGKSACYLDGNVYNCHPDNLGIEERRGRPMMCVWCKELTTKESSQRIKIDDRYQRYCDHCLRMMASWEGS